MLNATGEIMRDETTDTEETGKSERLDRGQALTVFTMMAGTFIIVLNQTLLSPVLPVFMRDFGIEATTVQWLTSGYSLVMAIVIPLSPYLLGRFGSRRLFLASMVFFIVGSLIASLASAFPMLLIGRMLQAVAAGITMPMSFTIVLLEFPLDQRGSAMGVISLIMGFAPAIGPTLSGVLVEIVGWRALFGITASFALIILVASFKVLADNRSFNPTTFDVASVLLSTVGLVALLYGLSSFSDSDNLPLIGMLVIVGALLLAAFAVRQTKLAVPLLSIGILKVTRYRVSVIVSMISMSVSVGMGVLLPLYIQNLLGYSPFMTGIIMLPGAVAGALAGLAAGKLFDRKGVRICVVPGACLMFVAMMAMTLLFDARTSLVVVGVAYGCLFVGVQMLNTVAGSWGLNALANDVVQHAQAVGNTLNQVSGSLITALVISITAMAAGFTPSGNAAAAYELGYHWGFIALLVMVIINFFIVVFLVRNKGKSQMGR